MKELRLNCERCGDFVEYSVVNADAKRTVIDCDECGKRHSEDSTFMVDPGKQYPRDETGTLIEKPY